MGNSGLIDPNPGLRPLSPACCFSGPVQCPATAPVAYKIKNYYSYSAHAYKEALGTRQSTMAKTEAVEDF